MLDVTTSYERPFDFIAFLGVFSYIIDELLISEVFYLHQTFIDYVFDLECQHAKCDCWLWKVLDSIAFFEYFS